MPTIVGISGSLRSGSFNTMLLHAIAAAAPAGTTVEIASIRDVPLYDADAEAAQGVPPAVQALKDRVAGADALLLVTPEYNGGIPGVFKNAIDWMSRPPADIARVFRGRPVAIAGATPGQAGTILAQAAWLPTLRQLGMHLFPGSLMVSGASKVFDANGQMVDAVVAARARTFIEGFAAFISATKR